MLTGTFDTDFAARTSSGSQAISMCVPPPTAVAFATFATRSASKLFRPEITCINTRYIVSGCHGSRVRDAMGRRAGIAATFALTRVSKMGHDSVFFPRGCHRCACQQGHLVNKLLPSFLFYSGPTLACSRQLDLSRRLN